MSSTVALNSDLVFDDRLQFGLFADSHFEPGGLLVLTMPTEHTSPYSTIPCLFNELKANLALPIYYGYSPDLLDFM